MCGAIERRSGTCSSVGGGKYCGSTRRGEAAGMMGLVWEGDVGDDGRGRKENGG